MLYNLIILVFNFKPTLEKNIVNIINLKNIRLKNLFVKLEEIIRIELKICKSIIKFSSQV
ncbi:hypothetical protein NUSPORA_01927 [Nucleospora cyclopteri]